MAISSTDVATDSLAAAFAQALAAKDYDRLRELIHPEVDFHAMTPRKTWEAAGPEDIIAAISTWFGEGDDIDGTLHADKVAWRALARAQEIHEARGAPLAPGARV